MPLSPEKKAELMAKYGSAPAGEPKPPPMDDEEMDPEERFVDSGDVLSEDEDDEDLEEEESVEPAEPAPPEGDRINDATHARRRGEEERAKKMPPIDKMGMREAAKKAVGNA